MTDLPGIVVTGASGRMGQMLIRTILESDRARLVGADIDTRCGTPAAAAFCTISNEQRLVSTTKVSAAGTPARAMAPINLSRALWRPTSSLTSRMFPAGSQAAAAWTEWLTRFIT